MPHCVSHDKRAKVLLEELWSATFPDTRLPDRLGPHWVDSLGFRGEDPSLELGLSGVLGLVNMIFFARSYALEWRRMLERAFDVATASLDVCLLVLNVCSVSSNEPRQVVSLGNRQVLIMSCLLVEDPKAFNKV